MPSRRVLFLANHCRGPQAAGGARTWHQAWALTETFFVELFVPEVDPLTGQKISDQDLPQSDRIKTYASWSTANIRRSVLARGLYMFSSAAGQFVRALRARTPAVVVGMGAPPTSALAAAIIAKIKHAPLVLDVRDIPLETAIENRIGGTHKIYGLLFALERFAFARASKILCVSPRMRDVVVAKGVDAQKIVLNYIGYDDFEIGDDADAEPPSISAIPRKTEDDFWVVYAGTIAQVFDVATVLRVASRLKNEKNIKFILIGGGERLEQYRSDTKNLSENIFFTGLIPKADVHRTLRHADVCIYPIRESKTIGCILGNKIFDYLGSGSPVIYIGPDGAVKDFLQEVGGGFFCGPEDDKAAAEMVLQLYNGTRDGCEVGRRARDRILAHYTARKSAETMQQVVDSVCTETQAQDDSAGAQSRTRA